MPYDPDTFENLYPYPDKANIRKQLNLMIEIGQITIPKNHLKDSKSWIENTVKEHFHREMALYRESQNEADQAWQKHQEKEHGFESLPESLKQKIHRQVWEDGHSGGYGEMVNRYLDLVPLVAEAYEIGIREHLQRK